MERLTFDGLFCDIAMCVETPGGSFCEDGYCSQRKVWERLKYYEDMEEQGRLVVLPCKVGDTVYRIWPTEGRLPVITEHYMKDLGMVVRWMHYFGRRVFLTREGAEKALKGGAE